MAGLSIAGAARCASAGAPGRGEATMATSAVPLTMLCAGAMHGIIEGAVAAFRDDTGIATTVVLTRSGLVRDRIAAGETFDVVVTTDAAVARLAELHRVLARTAVAIARSGIGVAVRAGAAKPRIDTSTAFVEALRNARSIAYADPASGSPSGTYLVGLLARLGLAAELAPKTLLVAATGAHPVVVCDLVARGDAEIGIQQISEIVPVAGVELVGPLPEELQHVTTFSAAVGADTNRAEAAHRLVTFLSSPAAAPLIVANGMQPA